MTKITLTPEDSEAIKAALLMMRERGEANPLLPTDFDLNGDGTVDAFGLGANDEIIVVHGVPIGETLYGSEGDDAWDHSGEGVS